MAFCQDAGETLCQEAGVVFCQEAGEALCQVSWKVNPSQEKYNDPKGGPKEHP